MARISRRRGEYLGTLIFADSGMNIDEFEIVARKWYKDARARHFVSDLAPGFRL